MRVREIHERWWRCLRGRQSDQSKRRSGPSEIQYRDRRTDTWSSTEKLLALIRMHIMTICSTEEAAGRRGLEVALWFHQRTTKYSSVLSDPAIDIVFVCSPDNNHAEQVTSALDAGKHVFCEKPLARSSRDFEEIRKRIEELAGIAGGYELRFREQYAVPRQLVASGKLGSLRFLRGTYVVNVVRACASAEALVARLPARCLPFCTRRNLLC